MAAVAALALAGCRSPARAGGGQDRDPAYQRGAADAVKGLYWAKQALEAPRPGRPAGRIMYYVWEESGVARDGRRLAPETVGVPVFIPAPAPAAEGDR